jgi:hypothetical protein
MGSLKVPATFGRQAKSKLQEQAQSNHDRMELGISYHSDDLETTS